MPERRTLLPLNGVEKGDPDGAWRVALSGALVCLGYPRLHRAAVRASHKGHWRRR